MAENGVNAGIRASYTKLCPVCGATFETQREKQVYDTSKCRLEGWAMRKVKALERQKRKARKLTVLGQVRKLEAEALFESFCFHCKIQGIERPMPEFAFSSTRGWVFDAAFPNFLIGVEFQGGIWRKGGGAHTGKGHERDMEKLNEAQADGWAVYQFPPDKVQDGSAAQWLKEKVLR